MFSCVVSRIVEAVLSETPAQMGHDRLFLPGLFKQYTFYAFILFLYSFIPLRLNILVQSICHA